jgi:LysR family glycine cleavage system transcriptional activator
MQHFGMPTGNQKTSLRGLRTFCVAARHESFRDAAAKLYITASAVSHQIKNLELEFGQRLFDRDGSTLTLTEAGQSLFNDMNPLIAKLDEVASHHKKQVSRTTLRISVQPFFASELFVPRLAEFTAAHPGIDIKVETSDESIEKHPGTADASIRVFKSAPKNLSSNHLFPLDLVPASSSQFRDTLKVKAKKVVSAFPRIVHENRPKAWNQWQKSSGIELPEETTSVRLDSMIAVVRAAQRGLGAALVPTRLCGTMFGSGTLVRLFEYELSTADAFYFACADDDAGNKNVQMLRDWVVQTFAQPC